MFFDRLRTSAILIGVVIGLLVLDANYSIPEAEGLWLLPLLLFFAIGTARDLTGLLLRSDRPVDRSAALVATAVITLSAGIPLLWPLLGRTYPTDCPVGRLGWLAVASVAATFLILIREIVRYRAERSQTVERALAAVFVSHYVGLPMALLVALRGLGDGRWGLAALLTTIAVTKAADVGAYFVGKAIGRRKLIPWLSPGKTWEGAVGGIAASTLTAWVCLGWLFPWLLLPEGSPEELSVASRTPSLWWAAVLGPVLAVSGMTGDLAESLVKRGSGAKDSGTLLPGLGGVWDVTDSLIAAVMPAFLCFAAAA